MTHSEGTWVPVAWKWQRAPVDSDDEGALLPDGPRPLVQNHVNDRSVSPPPDTHVTQTHQTTSWGVFGDAHRPSIDGDAATAVTRQMPSRAWEADCDYGFGLQHQLWPEIDPPRGLGSSSVSQYAVEPAVGRAPLAVLPSANSAAPASSGGIFDFTDIPLPSHDHEMLSQDGLQPFVALPTADISEDLHDSGPNLWQGFRPTSGVVFPGGNDVSAARYDYGAAPMHSRSSIEPATSWYGQPLGHRDLDPMGFGGLTELVENSDERLDASTQFVNAELSPWLREGHIGALPMLSELPSTSQESNASLALQRRATHVSSLLRDGAQSLHYPPVPWSTSEGPPKYILSSGGPSSHIDPISKHGKQTKASGMSKVTKCYWDESGQMQGSQRVFGPKQPTRRVLSPSERLEINNKKKINGVCPRCKRLKKKCINLRSSLYLPCQSCQESMPSVITSPCIIRASIDDLPLFRMGPPVDNPTHPLSFYKIRPDVLLLDDLSHSPPSDSLEVELCQDDIGCILKLSVSRYCPLPGDKTAYQGRDEKGPYNLEMPPYCISDMELAKARIIDFVHTSKLRYITKFVDQSNEILWNAFMYALKTKSPLVQRALSLWATTRLIERTWRVCGRETFGIDPVEGRRDPWKGYIPVTPIMDQQLDQIVIREVLVPSSTALLGALSKKLFDDKERGRSFVELYLTVFILLNNTEVQIASERRFALRYGFSGRYGPRGKYQNVDALFHAARTLLAHFHYTCRGNALLIPDARSLEDVPMSDDDRAYLKTVRTQVSTRTRYFESLARESRYETPLYFVHQMFSTQWQPGSNRIVECDEDSGLDASSST